MGFIVSGGSVVATPTGPSLTITTPSGDQGYYTTKIDVTVNAGTAEKYVILQELVDGKW